MLDAATMALLAKLKVSAKRIGMNIDLVRMSCERVYAEQILKSMSDSDDPELVLIVIQLMNQFGMIDAPTKDEEKTESGRYVGALR
jgi:hypothetical protein